MHNKTNTIRTYLVVDPRYYKLLSDYVPKSESWEAYVRDSFPHAAIKRQGVFVYVTQGQKIPEQGWKIHISARHDNAFEILREVSEILVSRETTFKFLADQYIVNSFNAAHWSRASSGKFITIYPTDTTEFRVLLDMLHCATEKYEGPRILSDKQYKNGIVHFRYGAFKRMEISDEYGRAIPALRDPSGVLVPDLRLPYFNLPHWLKNENQSQKKSNEPMVIFNRFQVEGVVRHANKGGLYRAYDTLSGSTVLLKEARPNTAVDEFGRDAVAHLNSEAQVLDLLDGFNVSPRKVAFFEQGGHYFLAQEYIDGKNLRDYIFELYISSGNSDNQHTKKIAFDLMLNITKAVRCVHSRGIILRDLTPQNIIVTQSESVCLIDFELAVTEGSKASRAGTFAYTSPEHEKGEAADVADDIYSLGAIIFFIACGIDYPAVLKDGGIDRSEARIRELFQTFALVGQNPTGGLGDIIVALLSSPRDARLSIDSVMESLLQLESTLYCSTAENNIQDTFGDSIVNETVEKIVDHLVSQFEHFGYTGWNTSRTGLHNDKFCLDSGYSGIGLFLLEYTKTCKDSSRAHRLQEILRVVARDTHRHILESNNIPSGFHFGLAGMILFLVEHAAYDNEQASLDKYLNYAIEQEWEIAGVDFLFGAAGLVEFYGRLAKYRNSYEIRKKVRILAEYIVSRVEISEQNYHWTVKAAGIDSEKTAIKYGYAHGTAGIISSLILAGQILDDAELLKLADAAGRCLLTKILEINDVAFFSEDEERFHKQLHVPSWCNGSSGAGLTFLHLYSVTAYEEYLNAAKSLAAGLTDRYQTKLTGQCCGLAGIGEFLIELYQTTGEAKYLRLAREKFEYIYASRVEMPSGLAFSGQLGGRLHDDLWTGAAGIGAFAHRILHGGTHITLCSRMRGDIFV